jgi:radical SAM superfamily enzyme YgiQ (UPF0313 family)
MKVALINPLFDGFEGNWLNDYRASLALMGKRAVHPPLALPTIAALTPPDIDIRLFDEYVEEIDFDTTWDLVGLSVMTSQAEHAYDVAARFRRRGIPVVMGGAHATENPEDAARHVDAVAIGEAEALWPDILRDVRAGALKPTYRMTTMPDLEQSPVPRWDLLRMDRYVNNVMQVSRGCPYRCEFCSVPHFSGMMYRHKRVDQVVREVEALPTKKEIIVVDDNFTVNAKFTKELLRALVPLDISFTTNGSIDMARDPELLELLRDAGCYLMFIGLESPDRDTLLAINKKHATKRDQLPDVQLIQSYGILIWGSFIVGLDGETESTASNIAAFVDRAPLMIVDFHRLTAPKHTPLFARMAAEGRLMGGFNSRFIYRVRPKERSLEAVDRDYRELHRYAYDYDNFASRYSTVLENYDLTQVRDIDFIHMGWRDSLRFNLNLYRDFYFAGDERRRAFFRRMTALSRHPHAGKGITYGLMLMCRDYADYVALLDANPGTGTLSVKEEQCLSN